MKLTNSFRWQPNCLKVSTQHLKNSFRDGFKRYVIPAVRALRRSPAFTSITIAVVALGIGAVTGIFSVVYKVLLEPLPYPDPDRLVQLITTSQLGEQRVVSIPKYIVWRDTLNCFESTTAYDIGGPAVNLTEDVFPEALKAARVSVGYFRLFGAQLALGRAFSEREDQPGGPRVAVISNHLWHRRFGSDPNIAGRTISLDDEPYKVVGVFAPGFTSETPADIWLPLDADPRDADHIGRVHVAARLKPGVTLEQAQSEVSDSLQTFLKKYPPNSPSKAPMLFQEAFTAIPLSDAVVGDVRPALYILSGAVGFVLLISCANAASLLLARASRRTREIAIRMALGAQRKQIVLQLLTESVLLSLGAGVVGLALGYLGVREVLAVSPGDLPRIGANGSAITLDWKVFLFTLLLSVLTGALFGLVPAVNASHSDISSLVKDNVLQSGMGFRRSRGRSSLVILEIALALVLLVGAGLLIRTFVAQRTISRGFDEQNILTIEMSLSNPQFDKTAQVAQLIRNTERRVRAIRGVSVVATTCALPLTPSFPMPFTILRNDNSLVGRYNGAAAWRSVSPAYFNVFRIRLLRGRLFTDKNDEDAAGVVLINRAMMKKYWQEIDANPIGEFIMIGKGMGRGLEDAPRQIVGVVADVRDAGFDREPAMYVPAAQVNDRMNARNNRLLPIIWVIRTAGAQPTMIADLERELLTSSGGRPLGRIRTMHQAIAASSARAEFYMIVLTAFAGIALVLAATGLYGLMTYSVHERTQEMAIRAALGASPRDVREMVVMQGLRLTLLGLLTGIPAALALARITLSTIFGIQIWDPTVLGLVALMLAAVALVAAYVPSVRATRVNPAEALRY
ncbi:MAG: ABC transporter permease [Bryobacteraceae bacterium]